MGFCIANKSEELDFLEALEIDGLDNSKLLLNGQLVMNSSFVLDWQIL